MKRKLFGSECRDVCWTSPERSAPYGYPEWAYTPKLRELYDNLFSTGDIDLLDQIGEAYITALYENPDDFGDGLKYQLPKGVFPKDSNMGWSKNKYIVKNKSILGYIDNLHFLVYGEIHWDPNNAQEGDFYNPDHVKNDWRRKETPKPKFPYNLFD